MNYSNFSKWKWLAACGCTAMLIVFACVVILFRTFQITNVVDETLDYSKCRTVFDQIGNGKLVADRYGKVELPPGLKDASANGYIYVTSVRHSERIVLFPSWLGKGKNVRGVIICSKNLNPGT